MSIVKLMSGGLWIARPGHDANTASEANLRFSPLGSTYTVYMSGTIASSAYTISGVPSTFQNRYRRAVVPFGKSFPRPPHVLMGGEWSTSGMRMVPLCGSLGGLLVNSTPWYFNEPWLSVYVEVAQMHLYTRYSAAQMPLLEYVVLENTL